MADNELMLEILKDIQARIGRLETGQQEIIRRLGRIEIDQGSAHVARAEDRVSLDRLAERVERIERRLEIRE